MDTRRNITCVGGAYLGKNFEDCKVLFSPKRKAEETVLTNASSPSKKQKVFSEIINNWNTLGVDNMAGNSGESDSHTKARSDFGGKVWK